MVTMVSRVIVMIFCASVYYIPMIGGCWGGSRYMA